MPRSRLDRRRRVRCRQPVAAVIRIRVCLAPVVRRTFLDSRSPVSPDIRLVSQSRPPQRLKPVVNQ